MSRPSSRAANLARALVRVGIVLLITFTGIAALNFPYSYDRPLTHEEVDNAKKHFEKIYENSTGRAQAVQVARKPNYEEAAIIAKVRAFAEKYDLLDKSVLDVGSGSGYLQDVVDKYTGLDIASNAAPLYHKKFVVGSATAMPFPDNSFDAAWSIWVFEHVPNPEQGFAEVRRVVRNGGVIFLMPAWNCASWLAQGYPVRPYSDLDVKGKLIKASIPLQRSVGFRAVMHLPVRAIRQIAPLFGPTRMRYKSLTPNFEKYWMQDSDAINSIDSHEALLWFTSRGDACLNCEGMQIFFPVGDRPLIIRIRK
jgi:SAM-dependent methyltransferase